MREIDLSANELICAGEDARDLWPLKEKTQLQQLEKKESFCSWFQAKNGTVEDQIPALKVGEKFYSMPMKVQKIIFRHVRLNNAFRNIEHTATGREKLWIPQTLLREKLRTARRFMVSPPRRTRACSPIIAIERARDILLLIVHGVCVAGYAEAREPCGAGWWGFKGSQRCGGEKQVQERQHLVIFFAPFEHRKQCRGKHSPERGGCSKVSRKGGVAAAVFSGDSHSLWPPTYGVYCFGRGVLERHIGSRETRLSNARERQCRPIEASKIY